MLMILQFVDIPMMPTSYANWKKFSFSIHGKFFLCNNILKGAVVPDSSTVLIQPSQKLTFRPIFNDDPSVSKTFVFCQYPNLKE